MDNKAVLIRPIRPGDASQVWENCLSMNTLEEVRSLIETNLQAYQEGKSLQLAGEVDGRVVCIATLIRNAHPLCAHRAEVTGLVVHPDYQGRGIARRLVEECHAYALQMGIEILEISCRGGESAEKIYPRLGFTVYGRLPRGLKEPWGNQKVYDIVYFYQPIRSPLPKIGEELGVRAD
jgi:GNAT superfamily N-acetyltransferase